MSQAPLQTVQASPFFAANSYRAAARAVCDGVELAEHFGAVAAEYVAAREDLALFDRSPRALLVLTGGDRQAWLHNLVTNDVKGLAAGRGCYAFACDVKGRIQFDLNILALADELWLDVAADRLGQILAYLERYLITEAVRIAPRAAARIALAGPRSAEIAAALGVGELAAAGSPELQHLELRIEPGEERRNFLRGRAVRHSYAGVQGLELLLEPGQEAAAWDHFAEHHRAQPAGAAALDALRIEAGIPWLGRDIDEKVVAPETGQIERAISYRKGCYLGQEIIERMRSLGTPARRLVRAHLAEGADLTLPATLRQQQMDAGKITSLVAHPLEAGWIGVGYLRTAVKDTSGLMVGDPPRPVSVREA